MSYLYSRGYGYGEYASSARMAGDSSYRSWSNYLLADAHSSMVASKLGGAMGSAIRDASSRQADAIENASRENRQAIRQATDRQVEAIREASREQVRAIEQATAIIGSKIDVTNSLLSSLNRRMDIVIEQQRMNNMLLANIAELLKIPNSEKERQQAITLGIKFFVNAAKDEDLYNDALDNFLKAEQMFPQDYFVLHRIGCIYLYVPQLLDVEKSVQYFEKAGKYAAVESDSDAVRIANLLTNNINTDYTIQTSDINSIGLLAADSYSKAALAYYIMGDDDLAVDRQSKAVKYAPSATNKFAYAKYLCRKGDDISLAMEQLSEAVDQDGNVVNAIPLDMDLMEKPETLKLLQYKAEEANNILDDLDDKDRFKQFLHFDGRYARGLADKIIISKNKAL